MELISRYSGIFAIFFYLLVLILIMKLKPKKEAVVEEEKEETAERIVSPLDLDDEDATVAALVAAIECRNEYKKNVQIVSIRKVG